MAEKSLDDQLKEAEMAKLKAETAMVRKQVSAKWYSTQSLVKFTAFVLAAVALYSVLDTRYLKDIRRHDTRLIQLKAQAAQAALDSLNREKEKISTRIDSLFLVSKRFSFETPEVLHKALTQYRMIKKKGYYGLRLNPKGTGIEHKFEQRVQRDTVIYDAATGLTWQGGSKFEKKSWKDAQAYIDTLNTLTYGGYKDWRLPTLEEAMSLMEAQKVEFDAVRQDSLHINARFKDTPEILPAYQYDQDGSSWVWAVNFEYGSCYERFASGAHYVRAVRSEE